ncbi:serine/threonine-protein kinase [Streptomyces sp. NPDC020983]|uniref:serine/threonine-protein kinase n=1 Tax=Streptomyces sp. NPDC020983 TaxID=3365106 RepID=UPI00379721C9
MERIGTYAVVRRLGEGGMGTVWLARSRGGRLVAVKLVRPELAVDPAFRARFRAEVAAARSVGGFHTAPVVDADPEAAEPWLATAYVPGPTLGQLLAAEGPMGEARLRELGAALAEALQAVHRCGLVHRDLKPGNIVMAADGPRVLDFGIARAMDDARLTTTGTAFGTPGFLAPEQAEGHDVGPAADVFALGAVLVAAAGGSAFGGGTPVAQIYRSVHGDPDLSAVPDGLRALVAACLAKDPRWRPTTGELLDRLSPLDAPLAAPAAPTSYPLAPPRARDTPVPSGPAAGGRDTPGPRVQEAGEDRTPGPQAAQGLPPQGAPEPAPPPLPGTARPPLPPPPAYPPSAYGAGSVSAAPPPYTAGPVHAPVPGGGALPPSPYGPGAPVPPPGTGAGQPGMPEFLAMDRRNAVVLDPAGVSLGVDGQVTEVPWHAVDFAWCERAAGRGHTLLVGVSLRDGTVFSCAVGTRRAAELETWMAQFDATLGYYSPEED